VYVVEGEKDVLAIRAVGGTAVCSAMGAGKADKFDWTPLTMDVVVVADKDEPGRDHAADIVWLLTGIARSVRVVEAKVGKDAADHIAAGLSSHEFVPIELGDAAHEEPIPLTGAVDLPPFPVDSLPKPLAEMVEAVAEVTQTDPAMSGVSLLSVLSAAACGHVEIEVLPGWQEPLSLYTATVAGPGERKSAVQQWMVRPLFDVEAALISKGRDEYAKADMRKQIAVKTAERLRNEAASGKPKGKAEGESTAEDRDKAINDAISAACDVERIEVPPIPRIVADDVTPEAAGSLLAEQGGRLAIISAEGGIFDVIAGRYTSIPNYDLWLKGHSGDTLKVDRKGRPPEHVPRPALTLGLMIQPVVLTKIAANNEFRGRGLLARFLYAFPVSKVGRRKTRPAPVPVKVEKAYNALVSKLASELREHVNEPHVLRLSAKATEAVHKIAEAVEPTLAGDGELASLADWGSKYLGAVARIAGILYLAKCAADDGICDDPDTLFTGVDAGTIVEAYRVGEYFKACAIKAFSEMGADQSTADAVYLLDRIQQTDKHEFSERDLARIARRFKTKSALRPAVDRLVEHGYLIPLDASEQTGGRPSARRYKRTKGTKGTKAPSQAAA
jgi:replicative DNA helicase